MEDTIILTPAMLAQVPLIVLVLQMAKRLPHFEKIKPYLPLISCGIGIVIAYATSIPNHIVAGLMMGLSASAGYSQFREISKPK